VIQSAQNRVYSPFDILTEGVSLLQLPQLGPDILIRNIVGNI
jgi:hypothetical protein